jgi:hypothetical protein
MQFFVNIQGLFLLPLILFRKFRDEHMNNLADEMVKRPCVFVIRINNPLHTQGDILKFFIGRAISVNNMNLQCLNDREGTLIILCMIERDRIRHTMVLLEKTKGIIELELLESKTTNMIK